MNPNAPKQICCKQYIMSDFACLGSLDLVVSQFQRGMVTIIDGYPWVISSFTCTRDE